MLVGAPPFYSENKKEMIRKILTVAIDILLFCSVRNTLSEFPIPKSTELPKKIISSRCTHHFIRRIFY
jgi:hypothetical protein